MSLNREIIFAALAARLATIPEFRVVSRRVKHWDDAPSSDQPALYIGVGQQTPVRNERGYDQVWELQAVCYVYCRTENAVASPGIQLNQLIEKIEAKLEWQQNEPRDPANAFGDGTRLPQTTLGGLVSHCWIDGPIETDEGLLGEQSVAILTIKMLAVS